MLRVAAKAWALQVDPAGHIPAAKGSVLLLPKERSTKH